MKKSSPALALSAVSKCWCTERCGPEPLPGPSKWVQPSTPAWRRPFCLLGTARARYSPNQLPSRQETEAWSLT